MSKLYRIIFIVLLILLIGLNVALFLYGDKILSRFNTFPDLESSESIMKSIDESSRSSVLDLSKIDSQKFKDLKEFSVDLSDFDTGDIDFDGDNGDSTSTEDTLLEFEVGNKNPFQPF
ncbi:MAG: hypothetical protein WCZ12_01035 [Patescibacteria group bacterium]